jgi:hypothetical protein
MISGANIALIALIVFGFGALAVILWKPTVMDFVKANLGQFTLLLLFLVLLSISFHVFHEASSNSLAKDFLAWLEQKAGEVLASIMTLVVSAKNTNQRAGDNTNGNGGGTSSSTTTTTSTSTKGTSMGIGTSLGTPH